MKKKDVLSFGIAISLVLVATSSAVALIMTENSAAKVKNEIAEESVESTEEYEEVQSTEIASSEEVSTEEPDGFDENEVDENQWINDYRYVLENMSAEDYPNAALIYVDDDEVPEMLLIGDESRIYTWHNGEIDFLEVDPDSFVFSDNGNLLTNDGKTYKIKHAVFEETEETIEEKDEAYILGSYSYEELLDGLKAGAVSANEIEKKEIPEETEEYEEDEDEYEEKGRFDAFDDEIHSYEFIVGDYSWTQAYESVQFDGDERYLARITSEDEYMYVSELIKNSNLQNYQFWIGAVRDEDSSEYHWINNFGEISEEAVTKTGLYEGAWAENEPSLTGVGDGENEVEETCIMMYCDPGSGVFKWKDEPDKVLSTSPSLAGKIGYIVEVEK